MGLTRQLWPLYLVSVQPNGRGKKAGRVDPERKMNISEATHLQFEKWLSSNATMMMIQNPE